MSQNIYEITYNSPTEVFIQRHYLALKEVLNIRLVARHQSARASQSASIQAFNHCESALVMPNFDHMTKSEKLLSLRYAFNSINILKIGPIRNRVLLGFFQKLRPSIIHFHFGQLAVSMRWIPEALGIPYTVSVRGSDIQVNPLRSDKDRQELYEALLRAAGIHTVCQNFAREIREQLPNGVMPTTIYTTVPVPEKLPPYTPPEARALNFLAVGRLHWIKDFVSLLKAIHYLRKEAVNAHLVIVGNGPNEDQLRYWISHLKLQSCVQLVGKKDFTGIKELLSRSHAYVQSSIAEGLSNSLAEAMAWGCPVFATEVGGTGEVIKDGETGFLLPPGEPERWPDILKLAQDLDVMEKIRKAAYAKAKEYFSARAHAQAFKKFYQQALQVSLI